MPKKLEDEKIIIYQTSEDETLWEVICEVYPNISTEEQVRAICFTIMTLNKEIQNRNEHIILTENPDFSIIKKDLWLLFPAHDTQLYNAIFIEDEQPHWTTLIFLANSLYAELKYVQDIIPPEKLKTLSEYGITKNLVIAEFLYKLQAFVKISALNALSNNKNMTIGQEFQQEVNDNYLIETFKYSFQNRAAKFTEVAYKIAKLDELLVEYVNKTKGRDILRMQINSLHAELQKIIPAEIQKEALKKLNIPINKTLRAGKVAQIKALIKEAAKRKKANVKINNLIKQRNFYEKLPKKELIAKNKLKDKIRINKEIMNPENRKGLVLSTGEYKSVLTRMANAEKIIGRIIIFFNFVDANRKVYNAYSKGENWKEVAFVEYGGFLVGVGTGWLLSEIATVALASLATGPAAVLVLPLSIIIFVGGSIAGTYAGKKAGQSVYDTISEEDKKYILEKSLVYVGS